MKEIIKAKIKKLEKARHNSTNMEDHAYYSGKIAGVKLASRIYSQANKAFGDSLKRRRCIL